MRLLGAGRAAEGAGSAADDEGLLLLAIDDHAFPFTTGLSLSCTPYLTSKKKDIVVPRGVEHKPVAHGRAQVLMFEI